MHTITGTTACPWYIVEPLVVSLV